MTNPALRYSDVPVHVHHTHTTRTHYATVLSGRTPEPVDVLGPSKMLPTLPTRVASDPLQDVLRKLIRNPLMIVDDPQARSEIEENGIFLGITRTEKITSFCYFGMRESVPMNVLPPENFKLEPTSDEPAQKPPEADQDKATAELMAAFDEVLANADARAPVHFTQGIGGPADVNRFGLSMDFDMTVLWIAAWYRRDGSEREQLLKDLRKSDPLHSALGSKEAVREWVSEMETALKAILPTNAEDPKPMSLTDITALIKSWNRAGGFLRGADNSDLLERIGHRKELIEYLALLLVDEQGKRTKFTTEYDVSPGWTALNFCRLWTVIGREHHLPPSAYGPRESHEFLRGWMARDPIGKQQ